MTHSNFIHLECINEFHGLCGVYLTLSFCGILLCIFSLSLTCARPQSSVTQASFRKFLLYYCSFLSFFYFIGNLFIGGWKIGLIYEWLITFLYALIGCHMLNIYRKMVDMDRSVNVAQATLFVVVLIRLGSMATMLAIFKADGEQFCRHSFWLYSSVVDFVLLLCVVLTIVLVIRIFDKLSVMKIQKNFQKLLLQTLCGGILFGGISNIVFHFLNFYSLGHKCDRYINITSIDVSIRILFRISYGVIPIFMTIWCFWKWNELFQSIDSGYLLDISDSEILDSESSDQWQ